MNKLKHFFPKPVSDSMKSLEEACKRRGIPYIKEKHGLATAAMKKVTGDYPTGRWHIHIGQVSVIRGPITYGYYEAYGGKYKNSPERFSTPKKLLDDMMV